MKRRNRKYPPEAMLYLEPCKWHECITCEDFGALVGLAQSQAHRFLKEPWKMVDTQWEQTDLLIEQIRDKVRGLLGV